jgi:hypothetical protein
MTRRTEIAAWAGVAVVLALGVMLFVLQASRPAMPISHYSGGGQNLQRGSSDEGPIWTYTP